MNYHYKHSHSPHRTATIVILALGVLFLSYFVGSWYGHLLARGIICKQSQVQGIGWLK